MASCLHTYHGGRFGGHRGGRGGGRGGRGVCGIAALAVIARPGANQKGPLFQIFSPRESSSCRPHVRSTFDIGLDEFMSDSRGPYASLAASCAAVASGTAMPPSPLWRTIGKWLDDNVLQFIYLLY